eukprot:NODE_61_length_26588_cov_1.146778.p3 type:complete len:538 gc:universal NODE_61_length_26588_cov_1.146778:15160-13547(-)
MHRPDILHLNEYRLDTKKDIRLNGYSQFKFKFLHEVDRQCIYIKIGINNITQMNHNTKHCHTVKIDGHVFSFLYIPPRIMGNLSLVHSELQVAFELKSIVVGDANMHMSMIQNGSNRVGRSFETFISNFAYSCRNSPNISTMRNGINVNDVLLVHQSKLDRTSNVEVLTEEDTSSDHFPIKFTYSLDSPIAILRNIRWSKLKNDPILRLSLQEKLKHEFETNKIAYENISVNDKWSYLLKVCTKHATKILGISNILDNSQMNDFDNVIQILNIRKNKLKRKLKKKNIIVTRRDNIRHQIDCIRKESKIRDPRSKKKKYLENINKNQSSAFVDLCRLRQSKRPNHSFNCDLERAIQYQLTHFSPNSSDWPEEILQLSHLVNAVAREVFTTERITNAFKHSNSNKVSGDAIPAILLKNLPEIGYELFLSFFSQCYLECNFPSAWLLSVTFDVFKSGNERDTSRYRPINLLSRTYKIFQQICYYSIEYILAFANMDSANSAAAAARSIQFKKFKHSHLPVIVFCIRILMNYSNLIYNHTI